MTEDVKNRGREDFSRANSYAFPYAHHPHTRRTTLCRGALLTPLPFFKNIFRFCFYILSYVLGTPLSHGGTKNEKIKDIRPTEFETYEMEPKPREKEFPEPQEYTKIFPYSWVGDSALVQPADMLLCCEAYHARVFQLLLKDQTVARF